MNAIPRWLHRGLVGTAAALFSFSTFSQTPGLIDLPFNPAGASGGAVVGPYPGGKIVLSGAGLYQTSPSFVIRPAVRFLENGTVDPAFSLASNPGEVSGHVVTAGGQLMLYGTFATFNGFATQYVVRLNDDATTDNTFKLTASSGLQATAVIPLSDGGAYVALSQGVIQRVDSLGTKDPSFTVDNSVATQPMAIALQPSGKLLVVQNGTIHRLDATGKRDLSYVDTVFPNVAADQKHVAVTADGSLYVCSDTQKVNGADLRTLVRLLPDGGVDPAFKFANDGASAGSRSITAMVLQTDGRLVIQGTSMVPAGLFRVNSDGGIDASFANKASNVSFLGIDDSGRILASGIYFDFTVSPPVVRTGLMRLLNDAAPLTPVITAPPAALTINSGQAASFGVTAIGVPTLAYRWQFNDADIPDATDKLFKIAAATTKDAGPYRVIASNANGSATSAPVVLTVIGTPFITQDPVGFAVPAGTATNLSAAATGESPLTFRWFHDGFLVPNAGDSILPFPSIATTDAGLYQFVASNAFGSATSSVAKVTVFATQPSWLVLSNATVANTFSNAVNPFRGDAAIKVVPSGVRGPVVLYTKGVERWNDAGQRAWSARYIEPDFGALNAITVDADGNIYVAGIIHFSATLGDLAMVNNSAVTGPNGHKQAFIAKLDPDGHGLWYRLFEAAGPVVASLTMASDGDVAFVGNNGGKVGRSYLGTLSVFEDSYMAAIAGKIAPDGTPRWLRSFPQFTANRSTCEADQITADAGGLYLSGLISFSIQFGTLQLQGSGPQATGWIGKLSNDGTATWIKASGSTAGQGDPIALRAGHLWKLFTRARAVEHWTTDGTLLATIATASSLNGDTATLTDLGVDGTGALLLLGNAVGAVHVGTQNVNLGSTRPCVWLGRWDTNAAFVTARLFATTTNLASAFYDGIHLNSYGVADSGDCYLVGSFGNAIRLLGTTYTVPGKGYIGDLSRYASWLAKESDNALLVPEITQQPIAAVALQTGDTVQIGIQATGIGPITFQWRHDGVPIPGETGNVLKLANVTVADTGAYDCVATNPHGPSTSDASAVTVAPPFTVRLEPAPQLVLLNGAVLAGPGIDVWAIRPGSAIGKNLSFVITNTSSVRFPLGGTFTMQLTGVASGGSYVLPAAGALGAHGGSWFPSTVLPDYSGIFLNKFVGTDSASLGLALGGTFDLHEDIVSTEGCCATGTFGISGGTATATFRVNTTSFVPDGNYQWTKDGVNVQGATSATLTIPSAIVADQGIYRCVITYQGYTETTEPAALRVVDGNGTTTPPVLTFTPFAPGATGLTLPTWPAGFVLQHTLSLSAPDWQTIATTPPVTIPFAQPGEFFRLVPGP